MTCGGSYSYSCVMYFKITGRLFVSECLRTNTRSFDEKRKGTDKQIPLGMRRIAKGALKRGAAKLAGRVPVCLLCHSRL